MGLNQIVAALDDEISRLEQVRSLLAGTKSNVAQAATSFAFGVNQAKTRKPRHLSAEARAPHLEEALGQAKEDGEERGSKLARSSL